MSCYWGFLQPVAADVTNYIANPSFELGTTGWAAVATGAISRGRYGSRGEWHLVINPAALNDGAEYSSVTLAAVATDYVFSVDIACIAADKGVKLNVVRNDTSAIIATSSFTVTQTGNTTAEMRFVRYTLDFTTVAGVTDYSVQVLYASGSLIQNLYIDAVMIATEDVTYIDGDQPGCVWLGAVQASQSKLLAKFRSGGALVDFYDEYGLCFDTETDTGFMPPEIVRQDRANAPGSNPTGYNVKERVFVLSGLLSDTTYPLFRAKRNTLIHDLALLRVPPVNGVPQPLYLRYAGDTRTLEIQAYYDGGLEFNQRATDGFNERVGLRFLAANNPYFYDINQNSAEVESRDTDTVFYAAGRVNGLWSDLGITAMGGTPVVRAIVWESNTQNIYIGGDFTSVNAIADTAYVAKYNIESGVWSALNATPLNGIVRALQIGPDGTLFIGGDFTNAGGVANADYICYYQGTTFNALGAGTLNGAVYALAYNAVDVALVIGGAFTGDGVSTLNYITQFGLSGAYQVLGTTGGLNGAVRAVAVRNDGTIIAGGDFTASATATPILYLGGYDGAAWYEVGGCNAAVYTLLNTLGDSLFVGGDFTTFNGETALRTVEIKTLTSAYVQWSVPYASGYAVRSLAYDENTQILYVGMVSQGLAVLSGDFFIEVVAGTGAAMDFLMPAGSDCLAIAISPYSDVFIGFDTTGTAAYAGNITITLPDGASESYPVFTFTRTGGTYAYLLQIRNETTGQVLFRGSQNIIAGETITVDTVNKTLTSSFGRQLTIVPGAVLNTWYVGAGDNVITALLDVVGAPTITAAMLWHTQYWSVDAADD